MNRAAAYCVLGCLMGGLIVLGMGPADATPTAGIVLPAYGASWHGSPKADPRIIELLESIDRRLATLEASVAVPQQDIVPSIQSIAAQHCSACHTPSAAKLKGKGFVLFTDDKATALRFLTRWESNRVNEAVQSGHMPPNGKLSPAEKSVFQSAFSSD